MTMDHMVKEKVDSSPKDSELGSSAHGLEDVVRSEIEPPTPYQLGWRTILALLALSMGNVCAALANTVCATVVILHPIAFFAARVYLSSN